MYPSADDDNQKKKKKLSKKKKQDKTKDKLRKQTVEEKEPGQDDKKDENVPSGKDQLGRTVGEKSYETETVIMGKVDQKIKVNDPLVHKEGVEQETTNEPTPPDQTKPDQTKPDTEQNNVSGKGDDANNTEVHKNTCTPKEPPVSLCSCKRQKHVCTPNTFGMNLCTNCFTKKILTCNRPGLNEIVGDGNVCSTCSKRKELQKIKCSTCGCDKSKIVSPLIASNQPPIVSPIIASNQPPISRAVFCRRCCTARRTHFSNSAPQKASCCCSTEQSNTGKCQSCTSGKTSHSKPIVEVQLPTKKLENPIRKCTQENDESPCKQVFPMKSFPTVACKSEQGRSGSPANPCSKVHDMVTVITKSNQMFSYCTSDFV